MLPIHTSHSGGREGGGAQPTAMLTDADIDFPVQRLLRLAGPQKTEDRSGATRAVWEDLHHRDPYLFLAGLMGGKRMFYRNTHFVL